MPIFALKLSQMLMRQTLLLLVALVLVGCSSTNDPKNKASLVGCKYRHYVGQVRNLDKELSQDMYISNCWEVVDFYSEDSLLMYFTNEEHNWQPIDSCCYNYSKEQNRLMPFWYEVNYPYITLEWNYPRESFISIDTPFVIIDDTTIFSSSYTLTRF